MAFPIGITKTPKPRGLSIYTDAYVFANGTLLAQASSVTVEKKSNSTPVHTLHKGFSGLSTGSGIVEITVDNAVPAVDFEFVGGALPDYWVKSGEPIEIGIVMASRQTILKGVIDQISYSHSVNDSSKVSFHLTGRLEEFE